MASGRRGRKGGRRGPKTGGHRQRYLVGAAVVVLVGAVLLFTGGDDGPTGVGTYTPVDGPSDIHGMAVDPQRPEVLYVATHHGLLRLVNDTEWTRVGDGQDDYMGFSMHPDGSTFWVSGHPKRGGNMGVRQSTDGGFTWTTLALPGVDFHAMAVSPADPDRLWGSFRGEVYRSLDGGHAWRVVSQAPQPVMALAPDPADPSTVHLAGPQGIHRSGDGGQTWTLWMDEPSPVVALDPTDPDRLFRSIGPALERSTDGGGNWTRLSLDVGGGTIGYLAFDPSDPDTLYAATYQVGLYKTTDAGETWTTIRTPSR